MKKASLSFVVLMFAVLLTSLQSFAQRDVVSERVQQTLLNYQRLRVADLMRISPYESRDMEVLSLSVMAQSFGPAQLEILQNGRSASGPQAMRRELRQIRVVLPARVSLESLELQAIGELFIESISMEVERIRIPGPSPMPGPRPIPMPQVQQVAQGSLLTIQVQQDIRGGMELDLERLLRERQGLTLQGAQIDRVIVEGQPSYGRAASVSVVMNGRVMGQEKYLSPSQARLPILLNSMEEVRSGLSLQVRGDAQIRSISIRVGTVRSQGPVNPGPGYPGQGSQIQRVMVGQEISSRMPLELSRLLPYESRLVRSVSIEARSYSQAQVAIVSQYGEVLGSVIVGSGQIRPRLQLSRPMSVRELRLESLSPVQIDSLELEFDNYPRY